MHCADHKTIGALVESVARDVQTSVTRYKAVFPGDDWKAMLDLVRQQSYYAVGVDSGIRGVLFQTDELSSQLKPSFSAWKDSVKAHNTQCFPALAGTVFFAGQHHNVFLPTLADGNCCY